MAYNLASIRERVRERLDDDTYDGDVIDQFINDTQRQTLNTYSFPFMETTFSGTLASGASTFLLPDDAQTVISFRITAPDEHAGFLEYMEFREFDKRFPDPTSADPGIPFVWTFVNNTFKVYPKTDQVYELDLRYLLKPTELTGDTNEPQLPESFSEILVLGAHQRCLERDDSYNEAQVVEQKVEQLVEDMLGRLVTRQIGRPHIMGSNKTGPRTRRY